MAVKQLQVSPDVAVINQNDHGRRVVSLALRNTIQGNDKGQFAFPATSYSYDGKTMNHFVNLNAEPAKSGEHAGQSEAMRFAEAGGFGDTMKKALEDFDKAHPREEGKAHERVADLEKVAVKMNAFNKKADAPNAIYYTDRNGNFVRPDADAKDAKNARIAKIEETIAPSPEFDVEKEDQLVKEHRAAKREARAEAKKAPEANKEVAKEAKEASAPEA